MITIEHLDHLVLTVADIRTSCAFYSTILGMQELTFGNGRTALQFGSQKINLHQAGREFAPKARMPMPGSADLCFIAATPLAEMVAALTAAGIAIEEGPIGRSGAAGPIRSIYIRDPDGNLIELSNQERT
jgi:catechol 2,3-dioxygenase-like lactoylglutathione lyase family enzyme